MKKVLRSHSERLPPARLYLDDVREIVETLEAAGKGVAVQADDYALESWEEIANLKRECIRELQIFRCFGCLQPKPPPKVAKHAVGYDKSHLLDCRISRLSRGI